MFEKELDNNENKRESYLDREKEVSEKIIEEALAWHKLFRSKWITAHELAGLDKNARPDVEGEIFKIETKNLLAIKKILDKDLDDRSFAEKLATDINHLLPRPFQEMQGMEQHYPHGEYDPTEHTFNALELLDTENLDSEQRLIARTALIFHDVGKVFNPKSRLHAYRSVKIARNYLEKMGFSKEQQIEILGQIRCHDALGEVARRDGESVFSYEDLLLFFPNKKALDIHHAVVKADVGSIPGLSWALDEIEDTYQLALKKIINNKISTKKESKLPFPRVTGQILFKLKEKLPGDEVYFDDINSEEDIAYRRKKFEGGLYRGRRFREKEEIVAEFDGVTVEEKNELEKLLIQSSLESDRKVLFILKLMGRDTDWEFVEKLEKKYGLSLNNLKAVVNINFITYRLWELNFEVEEITGKRDRKIKLIREKLLQIRERAEKIADFELLATHVTDNFSAEEIEEGDGLIQASDTRQTNHYEGNGVYLGAMGSYKNWDYIWKGERGKIFEIRISLGKTFPIIVDYNYPKMMLVALSEYLDIFSDRKQNITRGLKCWLKANDKSYNLEDWKLKLLSEVLEANIFVMRDENGERMAVSDTIVEPIVWGTLCRALKISRFMPMSELKKIYLPEINQKQKIVQEIKFEDYYTGLTMEAIRLRGVDFRDFQKEF